MRYVVWGIGVRGKMLLKCLRNEKIEAIIDSNSDIIGTFYQGIPIISFHEYCAKYQDCFIIISSTDFAGEIIAYLKENNINQYFDVTRSPRELPSYEDALPFDEMLTGAGISCGTQLIALWGINLFSVLLYDFLKANKTQVCFVDVTEQKLLAEEIKKRDASYKFIQLDEIANNDSCVLATDRFLSKTADVVPVNQVGFYRFPYLSRYKYKNLEQFYNAHYGKRCFIVATGPSLTIKDLDILHENNEVCLSMNYIYKVFSDTKWRPKYLFFEDSAITPKDVEEIHAADVEYKFIGDRKLSVVEHVNYDDIYVYRTFSEHYEEEGPDFSVDPNFGCHYGYTVLYQCLQFAVYMGFKDIYIVGADSDYVSNGLDGDHFIENYTPTHAMNVGCVLIDKTFIAYRKAKEYAQSHNIKIYNATRGGKLEVFERVEFDSLFSEQTEGEHKVKGYFPIENIRK